MIQIEKDDVSPCRPRLFCVALHYLQRHPVGMPLPYKTDLFMRSLQTLYGVCNLSAALLPLLPLTALYLLFVPLFSVWCTKPSKWTAVCVRGAGVDWNAVGWLETLSRFGFKDRIDSIDLHLWEYHLFNIYFVFILALFPFFWRSHGVSQRVLCGSAWWDWRRNFVFHFSIFIL